MDSADQDKRRRLTRVWRLFNPVFGPLAGVAPWWVALETTGRKTGLPRRTPIATGVRDGDAMWLIAAHGRHSQYVRNLEADPRVRLRHRGRWRDGTASVHPMEARSLSDFNAYARMAIKVGIDPVLVRISPRT